MKLIVEPICSGPAVGKQRIEVRNSVDERLGWLQPTNVDWSPILGGGVRFIAQQCYENNFGMQIFGNLWDALQFLGIRDIAEVDKCEFPHGVYDEFSWDTLVKVNGAE